MARKTLDDLIQPGKDRPHPKAQKIEAKPGWAALGFDVSMVSIAGTGICYDATTQKLSSIGFAQWRWEQGDDWFKRLGKAAKGHDLVHDILAQIGWFGENHHVFIGVEQAWPFGIVKRAESAWLYQQAQMHGAFCSGLIRYGYSELYEVNAASWRSIVATELGVKQTKELKMQVKDWAIDTWELPELPDIVQVAGRGKIERPESGAGAKAKAVHPNDVYDAAAVMTWMWSQIEEGFVVPQM